MERPDDRGRYRRLKFLTIAGPTVFVAVGEEMRSYVFQQWLPPALVSLVAVAVTLLGAVVFSWYVFDMVERIENERRTYKEAMLALQERERIAREMHDGVAQNLAVLNLKVHHLTERLEANDQEAVSADLAGIKELVHDTYVEVRQSLYDLKVTRRLEEGFWAALEKQLRDFERNTGISVVYEPLVPAPEPWNDLVSVQILRIVQEALSNVRKHSGATRVAVSCRRQNGRLSLQVSDNGSGFDAADVDRSRHFGLSVMHERAESVGAIATVQSAIGQGTTVSITLPDGKRGGEHGKGKAHVGG